MHTPTIDDLTPGFHWFHYSALDIGQRPQHVWVEAKDATHAAGIFDTQFWYFGHPVRDQYRAPRMANPAHLIATDGVVVLKWTPDTGKDARRFP